jgi:hypothetical protein
MRVKWKLAKRKPDPAVPGGEDRRSGTAEASGTANAMPFRSEMKRACKSRLEIYFRGGTSIQVFDSMHGDFLPRPQDRNRLKGDLLTEPKVQGVKDN